MPESTSHLAFNNQRDTHLRRIADLEQENARLQSRIAYLEGWKHQAEQQHANREVIA